MLSWVRPHPVLYSSDSLPSPKVASTLDLDMEGARIETSYDLIEGERLGISIGIDSKVIKCRGHAVHTQGSKGDGPKAGLNWKSYQNKMDCM